MQEELPELRQEGAWIVDNSPPEGLNASAKLLASEASSYDGLWVRKAQAVASCTRQRVPRVSYLEGNLGVLLPLWAPLAATSFLRIRGTCCHRCHCRLGNRGVVFIGEFRLHSLPRCRALLVPREGCVMLQSHTPGGDMLIFPLELCFVRRFAG